MAPELILSLATAIAPFCTSEVKVIDIPPHDGHIVLGEYRKPYILIDKYIPRHQVEMTLAHECGHEVWQKKTPAEQNRIARRLKRLEPIYSEDIQEEYAERFAIRHVQLPTSFTGKEGDIHVGS